MAEFLTDSEFENYRTLIYNESGIHFSNSNRSILESRLRDRVKLARSESVGAYYNLINRDPEEMKVLLDSVTTNLTRFFRNTAHFQTLQYSVIPDLVAEKRKRAENRIRVWSAGCSTGEEPYSVAIILRDLVPADVAIEVIGSDISLKSLMIGKEGFYPENRMVGVPEQYLPKYFEKKNGGYQVRDEIRSLVRFDYHNLKNDSGLRGLDIVFCRNVLIYFDEVAQKATVNRFWDVMNSHSYLFIGHSESLFGMNTQFEFLKTDWACIYRKFLKFS
ncbi:MAG TPA: protein-glutamate O-methyltransferase CheR [Spirochaetia bacterium]|nr:protein-glutamate O-methyltransferase CheR [Spirochaetia bacterium]